MILWSKEKARAFVVAQQFPKFSKGKSGVLEAIEHLGYVQMDTISVVERAHHHVLWSRVAGYEKQQLTDLIEKDKQVFDYWAHAASFLPMRDFQFSLYTKQVRREANGYWYPRDPGMIENVLEQIKTQGPMMSKDFDKGDFKQKEVWELPPVKRALQHLFLEGKLVIVGRKKFQKIYDIAERAYPLASRYAVPDRVDFIAHIIRRDLRAHGLLQVKEIGHLLKISIAEKQAILDSMQQEGEVLELAIKGLDGLQYYGLSDRLQAYKVSRRKPVFRLLSPFDNLIIQRKRTALLFDFNYTLECYVTAAKRQVGYFSLPMLYGQQFVGQIDLKADRKAGKLLVKNLVWEARLGERQEIERAMEDKLLAFATFNQVSI